MHVSGSDPVLAVVETRVGDAALRLFHLDAHFERATRHGATVVQPIHQHGYCRYICEDLEGNRWSFAQARPTMS
jgi:uncharacterized glyoxalase superfamily protein PhnB